MSNVSLFIPRALSVAVLMLTGCDSGPTLAPVRGQVTYQGAPLRRGTIVFTPDAKRGGHGPLASADIQSDGSFTLHTGDLPGAVVGWHRVTIVAVEAAAAAQGQRFAVPRSLIPEKYRDPELSGLMCEVRNKDNGIHFNLD